jgi:nitroreductase
MTLMVEPEALLSHMQSRRSIRKYQDRSVPDDLLEQVLEAARWAPSASNQQPWRFIVIRDPAIRRQIAPLAGTSLIRWAHVEGAPILLALCGRAGSPLLHTDVALAGLQLMLQAHALGLGTCWIGAFERHPTAQLLRLPPEMHLVALLTLGFPAEDPAPTPRKALAELVHYDVFGNRRPDTGPGSGVVSSGPLSIALRRLRIPFRI